MKKIGNFQKRNKGKIEWQGRKIEGKKGLERGKWPRLQKGKKGQGKIGREVRFLVLLFLFASDSHPYEHYITPPAIITTVLIDRRPNKPSTKTNKASLNRTLSLSLSLKLHKQQTKLKLSSFGSQIGASENVTLSSVRVLSFSVQAYLLSYCSISEIWVVQGFCGACKCS